MEGASEVEQSRVQTAGGFQEGAEEQDKKSRVKAEKCLVCRGQVFKGKWQVVRT